MPHDLKTLKHLLETCPETITPYDYIVNWQKELEEDLELHREELYDTKYHRGRWDKICDFLGIPDREYLRKKEV